MNDTIKSVRWTTIALIACSSNAVSFEQNYYVREAASGRSDSLKVSSASSGSLRRSTPATKTFICPGPRTTSFWFKEKSTINHYAGSLFTVGSIPAWCSSPTETHNSIASKFIAAHNQRIWQLARMNAPRGDVPEKQVSRNLEFSSIFNNNLALPKVYVPFRR